MEIRAATSNGNQPAAEGSENQHGGLDEAGVPAADAGVEADDVPKELPRIDKLLAIRPESLRTFDQVLAVLDSIHAFRAILDDVADLLKMKTGKRDCSDEVFWHGLGVQAELQERDERLVALEQAVKGIRLGAVAAADHGEQTGDPAWPPKTCAGEPPAAPCPRVDGGGAAVDGDAGRPGAVQQGETPRPSAAGEAAA